MADMGIGEIAAYAALAGSAVSAAGSIAQGNAAAATGRYNADAATTRANIDLQQATAQAAIDKQNTTRRMGQITADYAAAGVDVGSGSPLSVMSDEATQGELTRQLTLYRGKVAAAGDLDQAGIDRFGAGQAQTAGYIRGAGSILTGAASAAFMGGWSKSPGFDGPLKAGSGAGAIPGATGGW